LETRSQLRDRDSRLSPALIGVATLLGISIFLNYTDRGTLSLAAPLIRRELGLSVSQIGLLLSAFFFTYAPFQILSGWIVDRLDVNWILALGILVWACATAGTGAVHGFKMLLAMRLILGVGESVAYPSYNKIIALHFSENNRGRANSAIAAGWACGPAFGTLLGGLLMAQVGWRWFFVVLGVGSAVWLVPWFKLMPRAEGLAARRPQRSAPWLEILKQRSAWGTFAGLFSLNYLLYFLISWLPSYLVDERHFSIRTMSIAGGFAFLGTAISATISGWISDRWIASGGSLTRVRKTFTTLGPVIGSSIVLVSVVTNPRAAVALLFVACASLGICSSNLWAVTQTLAGPATIGRWTGLQNFVGNLAGVVAPAVTGVIVQRTGRFFWAFAITAVISLLGAAAWLFVVGPVEEIHWTSKAPRIAGSQKT
jgi:ACS family D-galactonate transporter-like MFS transporter